MIERVSRYYDGPLAQLPQKYTASPTIAVFRKFPETISTSYAQYTWVDGDTFSSISHSVKGGAKFWWEILDINPTITDPFSIEPGTKIYVPYGY